MSTFEASGNLQNWPPNVPGKPTQVAVFGMRDPRDGGGYKILWTALFPDLDKAMYWAAKKELETLRKHNFPMASRVIWQHDLTPEAAVEVAYSRMEAQTHQALRAAEKGQDPIQALGNDPDAPLRPIDYSKVEGFAVDIQPLSGHEDDQDEFFRPL